jgi:hypothetical protein
MYKKKKLAKTSLRGNRKVKGGKMKFVENISVKKFNFTCPSSFRKLNIEENMYVLVFPLFHLVYIGSVGLATQPHQLLARNPESAILL